MLLVIGGKDGYVERDGHVTSDEDLAAPPSAWERSSREGPDDGLPADAADDPQAGGDVLPAPADRHADAGPELPHLLVRRLRQAGAAALGRAAGTRPRARRPRRDALLEPLPAPRGLPRDPVRRLRPPHAQPAAAPERPRLHRDARGRQGGDRRQVAAAALGAGQGQDGDRARLRRRGLVRGTARRRGPGRLRGSEAGRGHRRGDVLHERHDRDAEGRPLLAPLRRPAHARAGARGAARPARDRSGDAPPGRADVPRERLGLPLHLPDGRREARLPGALPRSRVAARGLRAARRDDHRRRADDLDGHPRDARQGAGPLGHLEAPLDARRRLGGSARDDRRLPAAARQDRRARLGHDRDLPARDDVRLHRRVPHRRRGDAARRRRDAGPAAPVRRAARDRRRGQGDPVGRRGDGRAPGARPLGRRRLLRDARAGRALDGRRLVQDRRHRVLPPAGLRDDQGPLEGRDQVGRRVDLVRRPRERPDGASRRSPRRP